MAKIMKLARADPVHRHECPFPISIRPTGRMVKIMAKSIITQDGIIVNYSNLLAVFVDDELDDDENVLGYNLVGVTSMDEKNDAILLGSFDDEASAMNAKAELIRWLQSEAFSTFEMSQAGKGGDA